MGHYYNNMPHQHDLMASPLGLFTTYTHGGVPLTPVDELELLTPLPNFLDSFSAELVLLSELSSN